MTKRTLKKDGHVFEVTFDEYDTVDTITRDGVPLVSTNRDARAILRAADDLLAGLAPKGFSWP